MIAHLSHDSEMNIVMSRAAQHLCYPSRGLLPVQPRPRDTTSAWMGSPSNLSSPTSPLDFDRRIPSEEIRLTSIRLGSGSYGTVFKGRWHGRDVAIKQFKTQPEIDSFSVEVKQLSCVKHQNIVKLYGASSLSHHGTETAYLIMELSELGSLNSLLHERKQQDYDLRHACSWAMQAARGVAYLHSISPKPIVHRDLKPANLLLFSRGKVLKICDFGTACAVKTQMTNNTGSALYMAPEVFKSSNYQESADVFSWGIIFWEILVRRQPYSEQYSNPFQILWSVTQGARPLEIEGCPQPIWRLITRSWHKDPTKRPSMHKVTKEMEFIFSLTEKRKRGGTHTSPGTIRIDSPDVVSREAIDRILEVGSTSRRGNTPLSNPSEISRPSLPLLRSPVKKFSELRITSDRFNLEHNKLAESSCSSSTSLSTIHYEQNHYQNDAFNEHYEDYRRRLTQQEDLSLLKRAYKQNTVRARQYQIERLRRRSEQLRLDLQCDKKSTVSASFEEYENIRELIEKMQKQRKQRELQTSVRSRDSTPTCARPSSPPEEAIDALQQLSPGSNQIDASRIV